MMFYEPNCGVSAGETKTINFALSPVLAPGQVLPPSLAFLKFHRTSFQRNVETEKWRPLSLYRSR
jgi:hypothetical protein